MKNLIQIGPGSPGDKVVAGCRDQVVLATKCGLVWNAETGLFHFASDDRDITGAEGPRRVYKYLAPQSIAAELEASLLRLGTDHIDLYQTHWQDPTTPIEMTMEALVKLRDQGKIRAIGVSNATPEQMDRYRGVGAIASDQEKYSMLDRELEPANLRYCAVNRIAFLAYSPLAQGLLTGHIGPERQFAPGDQRRRKERFSVANRQRVAALLEALRPIAAAHNVTLGQLAIAWTFHQPGCSHVLVGARNPEQARENAGAGAVDLTETDCNAISAAIEHHAGTIV